MLKSIMVVLIVIVVLCGASCDTIKLTDECYLSSIGHESFMGTSSIQAAGEDIYHISNGGISRHKKGVNKCEIIIDDSTFYIFVSDNNIYHAYDDKIFKTNLDGQNKIMVWDESKLANYSGDWMGLGAFVVYQDILYIWNTGTSIIKYVPGTEVVVDFIDDVSSFAFVGEYVYYVEHAERTFSIFEKSLNSGEIKLVRGEGTIFEVDDRRDNMIDRVIVVGDKLFYSKRFYPAIYEFNAHGKDVVIADFPEIFEIEFMHMFSIGNKLYYKINENGFGKLFVYDLQIQEITLLAESEELTQVRAFVIHNDSLFYDDGELKRIRIKMLG